MRSTKEKRGGSGGGGGLHAAQTPPSAAKLVGDCGVEGWVACVCLLGSLCPVRVSPGQRQYPSLLKIRQDPPRGDLRETANSFLFPCVCLVRFW